ncbi:glycosyltransferase family 4 protein [Sulfuricella denitrificans]|uniref:glycosyltransferase family 4 protein n=1 Tax=Sulfuricella denitrificans TaxID=649841 RepID=UPI0006848E9A|nr:glycosyltransferase family 1 protein [Sulfuricella denitrificans]
MKRIGIFLGSDPGSGGMFQYSLAMLEALSALPRDRYVIVVAFFNPAWRSYIEPLDLQILPLGRSGREPLTIGRIWRAACLPMEPWRAFLWRLDPVARVLWNENCDLWIFPAQDHWSYLAPVQALVTIHDLMHRYESRFPEVSRLGRHFIREYRFSNICRFATAVLVDSEVGRQHVVDSYALSIGKLFPLPYLPPRYIFSSVTPGGFDDRYQLPPRFLFYPAQFWAHKNHDRLLQAVAAIRHSCPDVFLVLAGPKCYEYEKLVQRVADLNLHNHVLFTGYVPDADLPEFYRRARALVMPTFFGPTNIPPLEAFALGCPVAISGIYGIPEQVGDAALLFDPRSVEDVTDAVERLWRNDGLCDELRDKGYACSRRWQQDDFNKCLQGVIVRLLHSEGHMERTITSEGAEDCTEPTSKASMMLRL